ncbi:MAG: hypothetical protein JXK05_10855 [Campylobacterales bacterium]|nr:hypothetical protein [Campylobacterales bacterium]
MRHVKGVLIVQALMLLLLLEGLSVYLNFQIGWISSFVVLLGSMYSYRKLVAQRVAEHEAHDARDVIDQIEDPHGLYDEPSDEERDIAEVLKEEKAKLKAQRVAGFKTGAPALVSLYRLVPYGLLVVGFIGLRNNGILALAPYMLGLGVGILSALLLGKALFIRSQSEY